MRGTLTLALTILGLVLLDALANDGQAFLFLARKVIDLALALAFWRH